MEIVMLSKSKDDLKVSFLLKGINTGFANSLRRYMTDSVPVMAIDDVEFRKNNSVLYDEIVAHRLEGEGCARCTLKLTLKSKSAGYVYAELLKSMDPKVKPVFDKLPIVKLLKGQDIEFEATAKLGLARDHAKWSPGLIWYMQKPIISVKNDSKLLDKFRNRYPPQIFDKSGKIDRNLITEKLADACEGICDDLIKVERAQEEFVFFIESWGQLKPKELLVRGIDAFIDNLKLFEEKVKDI